MGGYNETWFSEREVKVYFSGNGYTSSKRAADYTAFRVCELTLANGFSHFIILDETSGGTTSIEQITPSRTEIRENGYGGLTATTREGETITVFKPSNNMTVFFIKESELKLAAEYGLRPISATFFIEKNAPEKIKKKISARF